LSILPVEASGMASTWITRSGIHQSATRPFRDFSRAPLSTEWPLTGLDHQQGALAPFGIGASDHGDQAHAGIRADDVLDLDRVDPLAARLDQILGPTREGQGSAVVDDRKIAGVEPAVLIQRRGFGAVVAAHHARPLDLQVTDDIALFRQKLSPRIRQHHVQTHGRTAGGQRRLAGRRQCAHRREFGHAPAGLDADAEAILHPTDQALGRAGAAEDDPLQRRQRQVVRLDMIQQPDPDGRHASRDGDALVPDQAGQALAIHQAARQDKGSADGRGRKRETPGVGVEHRHSDQSDVAPRQGQTVRLQGAQGVQIVGPVGVKHPLGRTGRARGEAEAGRRLFVEPPPNRQIFATGDQGLDVDVTRLDRIPVQNDQLFEAGAAGHQLASDFCQTRADRQHPVFRLIDHRSQMVGRQAGIEGVADHAHPHRPIPHLEMVPGVPGQGPDPVPGPQAETQKGARQSEAPVHGFGVGLARDAARIGRDDLDRSVPFRGVGQKSVHGQRILLHRPHAAVLHQKFFVRRRPY
jgi:hypothetical protein